MVMSKSKEPIKKVVNFLREIAIIVIGVAITLSASYFITKSNEKRDMHLYLNAIKMELEENLKVLDENAVKFQQHVKYADYLQSNDKEAINRDSVSHYSNIYYNYLPYTFNSNAFEMFKTSSVMHLLSDKDLLLSIWEVYSELSEVKKILDLYMDIRLEDMKKEKEWSGTEKRNNIPMYSFYMTDAPYNMQYVCKEGSRSVNEILIMLNSVWQKTPK